MKKILFITLILVSGLSHAEVETTQNYAYGAELTIVNDENMFSRVDLDLNVYTQTLSNKLDDVRVFNHNGQPVPFSLVNVYEQNNTSQTFLADIYPLNKNDNDNDNDTNANSDDAYQINVSGKNININLNKLQNNNAKYVDSYLLQIPDNITLKQAINRLVIDFDEVGITQNWQATANLLYSDDLNQWSTVLSNVSLMTLLDNTNNKSLKLNSLDIPSYNNYKARNWLISIQSQQPIPKIKSIQLATKSENAKMMLFPINFSLAEADNQQATYQLPSPQPLKFIAIELDNAKAVLPIGVYYKSNDTDKEWHKLGDYIIRKINESDEPQKIFFDNATINIKSLQIRTINASFATAPTIIAYRDRINVVFNSANNGPFILAWGSATATNASLPQQDLLSNVTQVIDIPEAYIGEPVKLAGTKALTVTPETSSFPRWFIWLGLIAGALFLVILALKLIKEIKKTT